MSELKAGMLVTPNVRLSRPLGEGGMGSVWVADHLTLEKEVAVKVIAGVWVKHPQARERFKREAQSAAKLTSPHVLHTYDHGVTDDGTPYIVMELLRGESLATRLERGPLGLPEAALILKQTAKALREAHQLGLVHRDIKPDNLFLTRSDDELFVKVLDFGIAKQHTTNEDGPAAQELTQTGAVIGTPRYMSPELLRNAKGAGFQVDLWALSVVAYYGLTGQHPFSGETTALTMKAILDQSFRPPSAHAPHLPPAVDAWFDRALSADLRNRFDSARELASTFGEAVGARPSVAALAGATPVQKTRAQAPLYPGGDTPAPTETSDEVVEETRSSTEVTGPDGTLALDAGVAAPLAPTKRGTPAVAVPTVAAGPVPPPTLTGDKSIAGVGSTVHPEVARRRWLPAAALGLIAGAAVVIVVAMGPSSDTEVPPPIPAAKPKDKSTEKPLEIRPEPASPAVLSPEPTPSTPPAPATPVVVPKVSPKVVPQPQPQPPQPPPRKAPRPRPASNCNPPYTLQGDGTRRYKAECL